MIPDDIEFDFEVLDQKDDIAVRFITYVSKRMGAISIERGTVNGRPIIMGDVMPLCRMGKCKLAQNGRCKPPSKGSVCIFISAPIRKLTEQMFRHYFDLDDVSLLEMGLILVPLYVEFFRRRLDLMEHDSINIEQEKGGQKSNPSLGDMLKLVKQIREIRKDFDRQLEKQKPASQKKNTGRGGGNNHSRLM